MDDRFTQLPDPESSMRRPCGDKDNGGFCKNVFFTFRAKFAGDFGIQG
jgi:hypothetical protein